MALVGPDAEHYDKRFVWLINGTCQKICLTTDESTARAVAQKQMARYMALPNYRNNRFRLGFTEDEIERRDNRFVDAVVVWGDEDRLHEGVQAHYDAGADHVCVQPLSTEGATSLDWNALEALSPLA